MVCQDVRRFALDHPAPSPDELTGDVRIFLDSGRVEDYARVIRAHSSVLNTEMAKCIMRTRTDTQTRRHARLRALTIFIHARANSTCPSA